MKFLLIDMVREILNLVFLCVNCPTYGVLSKKHRGYPSQTLTVEIYPFFAHLPCFKVYF